MRLYISVDIEGIAGVVSSENTFPGHFEYEQARDWMTNATLSACEAAHELGVREIVVSDSHGNGQNIRWERMPEYVQLVRSWPRPLSMMQGVEAGSYDGAFLIGYHASASSMRGVLAHTMSSQLIQDVRLNGQSVSEIPITAAIAGHFGVPLLLLASDDAGLDENAKLFGEIATVQLKTAYGAFSALNPAPATVDSRLRDGVREALKRIGKVRPYVIEGPIDIDIHLRTRFVAEWLSYLEHVERLDAFTIRHRAADIVGVSKFLQFLCSARTALTQ